MNKFEVAFPRRAVLILLFCVANSVFVLPTSAAVFVDEHGDDFVTFNDDSVTFWSRLEKPPAQTVFDAHGGALRFCFGYNRESGEASDCLPPMPAKSSVDESLAYQVLFVNFDSYPYLLKSLEADLMNGVLLYITLTAAGESTSFRLYQKHKFNRDSWDLLIKQMGDPRDGWK
jgi:hypothetical protein